MEAPQNQTSQEKAKKSSLENLSREELIIKCKQFLGLAQKAKQSKDEFAEENKKVKDELSKCEMQREADKKSLMAMKEIVESLTESKLSQTAVIDELQTQNNKLTNQIKLLTEKNNKLIEISIRNESLERQIQRLTDENEDLITNMEIMEKKLQQMNEFGIEQQRNLILLDDATTNWEIKEKTLQNHLEDAQNEIVKLKQEISDLQEKLKEYDSIKNNTKDYNVVKQSCARYEELCAKQTEQLDSLRKSNDLQNGKMQNIKTKLIEVTMKLKKLKKSKQILSDAVQEYYISIPKWQKEMCLVSNQLCAKINSLANAKRSLEQKVMELNADLSSAAIKEVFYQRKLESLIECCNRVLIEQARDFVDDSNNKNESKNIDTKNLIEKIQHLEDCLQNSNKDYIENCKKLSILQEKFNKQSIELENKNSELNSLKMALDIERSSKEDKLHEIQEQNQNLQSNLNQSHDIIEKLKREISTIDGQHSDLLDEMRELNEALKGRGDVISRQQDKISGLEKELATVKENLSKFEMNLMEKDNLIAMKDNELTKMSKEINDVKHEVAAAQSAKEEVTSSLRDRIYGGDNHSEVLSTSTISKADESIRMKEVDESFEEKYNKLRYLAIKLKKKVQEQANQIAILESDNKKNFEEKNEIKSKLGTINLQVKNLQALQKENDKLQDKIEEVYKEKIDAEKQIKDLNEKIQNLSIELTSKHSNNDAVFEYENQIKSLKEEKEEFNAKKKEWEEERDLLKVEICNKEKELNGLRQQNEKLKADFEKSKAVGKKSSVLNLEIAAYEKSLNEATQNLKLKEALIKDFQESLSSKDESIDCYKKEIKVLEQSLESEKTHSLELKQQMDIQQTKLKEYEHEKIQLRDRVQDLTMDTENLKSQVDELRIQLSQLAGEKDKLNGAFQKEKDDLYRRIVNLEENCNNLNSKLKTTECELEDVRAEYANYKVRAQSVLRQNQTKETSRERELEEEVTVMRSTIETLHLEITSLKDALTVNEKRVDDFREDNERIQKRCKELMNLLEESRHQNEIILEDSRKQSIEYQESLKAHRLQIDAINNCYKQQVEELEKKHAAELEEFKKIGGNNFKESKLVSRIAPYGGSSKTSDEQKIDLILMEREDAEGSETSGVSIPKRKISTSTRSKHDLIPLDELLSSSLDEHIREEIRSESPSIELQMAKEKLQTQESRVRHLTALLAETEQDLVKVTQLNEVLKEEVRRYERSIEREKHIQNSEYLKNIVFKFITLNSVDERTRLIPVLNTLLKLSPEETQILQNVAKGSSSTMKFNSFNILKSFNKY